MFNITFNGVSIPSFVKVRTVDFAVLPDINHSFKQIAGGFGLLEAGTTLGGKVLKMKIIIVKDADKSLSEMSREFAYWLRGNDYKLSDLIISDDISVIYTAKINTKVDIADLIFVGEGSLEFIVPSGSAKGSFVEGSISLADNGSFQILYNGTAPTQPAITWTPSADLTNATVNITCTETGDLVSLTGNFTAGVPVLIDCKNKVVKKGGLVDLKMINFTTNWINFKSRGTYTITASKAGTYYCSYNEYWL